MLHTVVDVALLVMSALYVRSTVKAFVQARMIRKLEAPVHVPAPWEVRAEARLQADRERRAARKPVGPSPFGSQEPTDGYW